jgi:hypothetical protein
MRMVPNSPDSFASDEEAPPADPVLLVFTTGPKEAHTAEVVGPRALLPGVERVGGGRSLFSASCPIAVIRSLSSSALRCSISLSKTCRACRFFSNARSRVSSSLRF